MDETFIQIYIGKLAKIVSEYTINIIRLESQLETEMEKSKKLTEEIETLKTEISSSNTSTIEVDSSKSTTNSSKQSNNFTQATTTTQ